MHRALAGCARLLSSFVLALTALPLSLTVSTAPSLPAQVAVELPRLFELGPAPDPMHVLTLDAAGRLWRDDATEIAVADRAAALRSRFPVLRLQADRRTPMRVVRALLDECPAAGISAIDFVAMLPDGQSGSFRLALPPADTTVDLLLSLHDRRAGVPPSSATPLLQRFVRSFELGKLGPLVLGVDVPPTASCGSVLATLLAVHQADVTTVVVRCEPTAGNPAGAAATAPTDLVALAGSVTTRAGAFALDLGPRPMLQVQQIELPQQKPVLQAHVVGCTGNASGDGLSGDGGGAGGRYGGRGGRVAATATGKAIESGLRFLQRQQAADGSFAGGGFGDIGATSLAVLAALGDGSHLDAGPFDGVVVRGVGALLARQQPNGGFPGSMRDHALATLALTEAYLLSGRSGQLLHASLRDALDWLAAQCAADGSFGFAPGLPTGDTLSTASAVMALAAAEHGRLTVPVTAKDTAAWFDQVAAPTGVHRYTTAPAAVGDRLVEPTAAALFARYFAGQVPAGVPIMGVAADYLLATAELGEPLSCYWTTYALFQQGGRHWSAWSERLRELTGAQVTDGEAAGSWSAPPGMSVAVSTALRTLTLEARYRYSRLVR